MIVEFDGYRPRVGDTAFVAPTAVLVGNVVVEEEASVWYGAVLRADHGERAIIVGARSSVQDNCVIHVALDRGTTIGDDVTIGHGAILEACEIGDGALVGMNAVVLQGARVGSRALVAAGSTVLPNTEIPSGALAAGSPAVVKGPLSEDARWWVENGSLHYVELGRRYRLQGLDDR